MKENYKLEKWIWNHTDFDKMGWHDCPIWAMSFENDVKFDLDYILGWVKPESQMGRYLFWISPATLIFKNITNFSMQMETDFVNGLEISDIERKLIEGKTNYFIEAQEGRIQIETEEFWQIIRRPPTLQTGQVLSGLERGPLSFSEISEKDYKPSELEIKGRQLAYKLDVIRNQKTKLQIELDDYDFISLNSKERILKKRELKSSIERISKEIEDIEKEMSKIYGY